MAESDLSDAALALAAMTCCIEEFDKRKISSALVTAIVALRTNNEQYGMIRLEQARDAVAIMSAQLAGEVIKLDTAIKHIQEGETCSTTTSAGDSAT
jgi:hypothetical protein